jgi:hypothetical protein
MAVAAAPSGQRDACTPPGHLPSGVSKAKHRLVRRLALQPKEIEALRQLVARVEAVDVHVHGLFVERATLLTRFCRELVGDESTDSLRAARYARIQ